MLALMLVAALGLSPAAAPKKAPKTNAKTAANSWVVLVKADNSLPASWGPALRRAAETEDPKVTWVEPPAVSLEEAQLAAGCAAWGPACAGLIASLVGAQTALVIELAPSGDGAAVTVQPVRAASGVALQNAERGELPDRSTDSLRLAEAYVRGALRGQRPTLLVLTSDVPNAEVVIDGRLRGRTPLTLVDEVDPGSHTVLFRLEGRAPVTRAVDVKAGVTNKEHALLGALGPPMVVQPTVGNAVGSDPAPMPASPAAASDSGDSLLVDGILGSSLAGAGVIATGVGLYAALWPNFLNGLPLPFLFPYGTGDSARYCLDKGCATTSYGDAREAYVLEEGPGLMAGGSVLAALGAVGIASGLYLALSAWPADEAPSPSTAP